MMREGVLLSEEPSPAEKNEKYARALRNWRILEDLLKKEEEFLKLNSELDLKTKDLMEQVNQVMKQQATDHDQMIEKWSFLNNRDDDSKSSNPSESEIEITYNKLFKAAEKDRVAPKSRNGSGSEEGNNEAEADVAVFTKNDEENRTANRRNSKVCHSANESSTNTVFVFPGKLVRHKSDIKLKEKILDSALPESLKGMGQENIIRFLKAKVKVLTEQLEVMHAEEKKHIEKIKELQTDRERVAEDRDKWIQQANIAKNVLMKHEQHASNIVVQLQNIQAENGHLKREVDKLKKELKQITQNSGSNEVRLNRSIEEVEKLKASLKQAKQEEKDLRETHRKKTEELSGAVKRLDKQRIELLHAFKKQLVIIDNLKKQKGLVEAGKFVKTVEDDFMEFLDWNPVAYQIVHKESNSMTVIIQYCRRIALLIVRTEILINSVFLLPCQTPREFFSWEIKGETKNKTHGIPVLKKKLEHMALERRLNEHDTSARDL